MFVDPAVVPSVQANVHVGFDSGTFPIEENYD
jgi:hypothetical protein